MPAGWQSIQLAGQTRMICYQKFESSCALACAAMAINRFDGSQPTERAIMNILGGPHVVQKGYVPAPADQKDVSLWRNDSYDGTYAEAIPAYLKAYGIASACRFVGGGDYDPSEDPKMKGRATRKGLKNARIVHFVFTEGIVNDELIVLDPAGNGTGGPALAEFDRFRPYRTITYRAERGIVTFDVKEVITIDANA